MILLSLQGVRKSFGTNEVLRDASLVLQDGQRMGLVGVNGSGKSTLMKIIAGLESSDGGAITMQKGLRLGYLAQQGEVQEGRTVLEELESVFDPVVEMERQLRQLEERMAECGEDEEMLRRLGGQYDQLTREFEERNGYGWKSTVQGVLAGLGFRREQQGQLASSLSGGERTRLCLGRMLLTEPDLLLLEMNIEQYLDPKYGILDYLCQQKANGRIRHLGFSAHGSVEVMERFLEAYGDVMEFCQLQTNYLDWDFQDAKAKVALLRARNIPVVVMEPVRGGRLAQLNDAQTAALKALRPDESAVSWAFRFAQSLPDAMVTLSGASTMEQLRQNIATYAEAKPLTKNEWDALMQLAASMVDGSVPCTACHYCTSHCPQGLDIPMLLKLYNEHNFSGKDGFLAPMALMAVPKEKHPAACIACGSCEAVCPQQIKIAAALADFNAMLGN